MARPLTKPLWATLDEIDPVNGSPNKAIPTTDKQNFGQRTGVNTLRQDINFLFNLIAGWITFFDDQFDISDVYIVDGSTTTTATISTQLGGTWDFIDGVNGDDTLAGQAVQVFIKTIK